MTETRDVNKTSKAKQWAEQALVDADELAKSSHPFAKRWARQQRKEAKKFRAKAERRSGKLQCEDTGA